MRAEFTDDLITGNELIDSQHEELIGRINKLLDSCEAGEGKISAIKMLDYLAKYTDTHFGDEEALQKEVCYPRLRQTPCKTRRIQTDDSRVE